MEAVRKSIQALSDSAGLVGSHPRTAHSWLDVVRDLVRRDSLERPCLAGIVATSHSPVVESAP